MEPPVRKVFPIFQIGNQMIEDARYAKAVKDYNEWVELEKEEKKLNNERVKLENEEKRALIESLRKRESLGGSNEIYERVRPQIQQKEKSFFEKLNDFFNQ